ncbi:zinc finger, CCHC-type containing protein [Tanacetum coccineum]
MDLIDQPMWAIDRNIEPTPGPAITRPNTADEFDIKGITHNECESLTEAWLHMKEFLRFYHGHAEGIFIYKIPKYAYQLLEEKVSLKLVWAKNQKPKSVIRKTVAFADEDFKHTLKDKKDELTLVKLGSHLRIYESLKVQEIDKPRNNNVVGSSVVNMVKHNNYTRCNDNKGKCKHRDNTKANPRKKSKLTCWKCGKTGYLKRDYKGVKIGNKTNGSSIMDDDVTWLNIVVNLSFILASKLNDSTLWHAILCHVNFKRMQDMSKDRLIQPLIWTLKSVRHSVDMIHETTALYTPQQNGVSERKNKVLKEMVNFMLSYLGLSEGFYDEAMLTAFYLLNRVLNKINMITPYELWTKRKPNLNYLRIWGCKTVVRLHDPGLKTLGDKGIDYIFIGFDEHTKAFISYVIEPNEFC